MPTNKYPYGNTLVEKQITEGDRYKDQIGVILFALNVYKQDLGKYHVLVIQPTIL